MADQDKELQCSDCGGTFTFTAGEQEFYKTKGYVNEPKRCPSCRESRRTQRSGTGTGAGLAEGGQRQMFPAVCAGCGQETQVPFQPKENRPVYCRTCYFKSKTSG